MYKKSCGVSEEDVAKRLIDYGFHAPTMSWPHVGGLMIEPTESEDKLEMDRFCEAMAMILREIQDIENEVSDPKNNLLKNAPHTLKRLISSEWDDRFPYSREQAAYPASWIAPRGKVFPQVSRVDSAYGDRNLVTTCPSVDEFFYEDDESEATN